MAKYKNDRQLSFTKEDQVFNWGIYNGKTIITVMEKYPDYIHWCVKNIKTFKIGKKLQVVWDKYC